MSYHANKRFALSRNGENPIIQPCDLDLWPITLKCNRVRVVVRIHVHAKFNRTEYSGDNEFNNDVFRLSIAWSVPDIRDQIYSCRKSSALLITQVPLHLVWWNFARTRTSKTLKTLFNFKVIGQRSRSHEFLAVFLCAWCCGYPRTVLSLEQGLMILLQFSSFSVAL